jgi:benzodiazapine receptor
MERTASPPSRARTIIALVAVLAVPVVIGAVSGLSTADSVSPWYLEIARPSFTPPSWVFGPVWTTLYLAMGFAAFLVWRSGPGEREVRIALWAFVIQLVLNGIWTPLFFGVRNLGLAFAEILVLWVAIAVTLLLFRRRSLLAGALLVPYLAWVSFAAVLNFSFWRLNA